MSDFKIQQTPAAKEQARPILTHEKSLSQKIARGSEAGDLLDQQMAMLGIQLITQLNVLMKISRMYQRTNAALDKPVETMLTLIKAMTHDQPIAVRLQNDFLFLGNSHLKVNAQQMAVATSIIDTLNSWKIGGGTFSLTVEAKDLREFAALFVALTPDDTTLDDLRREMAARGIAGIELEDPRQLQVRDETGTAGKAGLTGMDSARSKRNGSEPPKTAMPKWQDRSEP